MRTPEYTFTAEAVIASNAEGYTPEWEWSQPNDTVEFIRVACVRLANAITSKYKRFNEHYAGKSHVKGNPFVICVTPFEQPHSFSQNLSAIRRVLYGYELLTIKNEKSGKPLVVGEAKFENTYKDNGADIPLSLFLDPKYACVSAIIFSTTARMCKLQALCQSDSTPAELETLFCADRFDPASDTPRRVVARKSEYKETVLDGLHVFLNPNASIPLDVRPFRNQAIALHSYNLRSNEYMCYMPDDFLLHRFCHTFLIMDNMPDISQNSETRYRQPSVKAWPDNELRPVEAQVMMFDQNHLAHYRGWTILVARDTIDNDWSAQAVVGTFTSVPDYMNANRQASVDQCAILKEFYPTKMMAWENARKQLDDILAGAQEPNLEE